MSSASVSTLRRARAGATALAAGLALTIALTGCGSSTATATDDTATATDDTATDNTAPEVVVSDAWVRATTGAEDPSMTGAFMALDNEGSEDVSLTGASSPVAGTVELHEMAMADGSMTMREAEEGFVIEAGYGQVLMPGGNHVMLMGLTDELAPGDEIELVLEFSDGTSEELTVPVKAFTEEEGHYHENDEPHSHPTTSPSGSSDK
jgi:periplasmic copper chaperone A